MSSVEESMKENLTCSICVEIYIEPKTLPCLHSFCASCLYKYIEKRKGKKSHPCPICMEDFQVPNNQVSQLKTNFCYQNLIDLVKITSAPHNKELCSFCRLQKKNVDAVSKCLTCGDFLCNVCAEHRHSFTRQTIGHEVVPLEDVISGKYSTEMRSNQNIPCTTHAGKYMQLFCDTCSIPVCPKCIISNHDKHKFIHPSDAQRMKKKELQNLTKSLSVRMERCQSKKQQIIENIVKLKSSERSLKTKIKTFCDNVIEKVNSVRENAEKDLQNITKPQHEALQNIRETITKEYDTLEQSITFCENVMKEGSDLELLSLQHTMIDRLSKLSNYDTCTNTDDMVVPDFKMPTLRLIEPNMQMITFKGEISEACESETQTVESLVNTTSEQEINQNIQTGSENDEHAVKKNLQEVPCKERSRETFAPLSLGRRFSISDIRLLHEKSYLIVKEQNDKLSQKYTSVAWVDENSFTVADANNMKIKLYNIKTQSIRSVKIWNILNVTSTENKIACKSSSGELKLFDHDLNKIKEFHGVSTLMTTRPDSMILAWFDKKRIFVQEEKTLREVIPTDLDGKVIVFDKPMFGSILPNGQVAVSEWSENCVFFLDKNGKLLSKVYCFPGPIYTDTHDSFYIQDYSKNVIYVYCVDGSFRKEIDLKCVANSPPLGISIYNDKLLTLYTDKIGLCCI